MKYALQYHGMNEKCQKYFTIITDDGRGLNQCGVDICFLHFILNPDKKIERISYMSVPTFTNKPSIEEANELKNIVTRLLGGLIPLFLPVFVGSHADFFKNGGSEKMVSMMFPYNK